MVFVRISLLFKPVHLAGVTVTPAGASVTYLNFTARVGTVWTGKGNAYLGTVADRILLRGYRYPGCGFYPYIGCIVDAGTFFSSQILPGGYKV